MFQTIKELPYSFLLITELITFTMRVTTIIGKYLPDDAYLKRHIDKMMVALADLERAMKSSRKSAYTEILLKKDHRRDTIFRSIVGYLDGMIAMKIRPEIREMALCILNPILKQGRKLDRLSYSQESARLRLLLEGMSQPEAQLKLEALNLKDAFEELRDAQADFENTYHTKIANDVQDDFPQTYNARNEMLYRMNVMLTYLDADATDDPSGYATVGGELNEVIAEFAAKARARKTLNGNEQEPAPQPLPTVSNA